MPAWQATSTSLVQALSSESRSTTRKGGRFRNVLVAGEVAAAVLLLCGAGLLLRTMLALGSFDSGYRADGDSVLTLDFSVPAPGPDGAERLLQFYDSVEREIQRALPNVRSLGWASSLPWGNSELGRWPFEIVGDPPIEADRRPNAEYTVASQGYFRTLDIPIVAGRGFADHDTREATPVCVVNEAFVRRHLRAQSDWGAGERQAFRRRRSSRA